jgi:Ser/Thr protein kinase RdoA (MazF antagonist)
VKIGATPVTAEWTRIEARTYGALSGWFLPTVLGFDDDGDRPTLALEDLSAADWPPPWSDRRVVGVLDALAAIHATPPPAHLTPFDLDGGASWQAVGADPGPFLALGLCSAPWLTAALPALLAAAEAAPLSGASLVHLDIRSDNLCFRDGRAVVLDWNHATIANAALDVAFWLPSLESEGGPPPESILPNEPGLAAWVAGFFCAHAGLPFLPDAPHVRALQLAQARTALPWAARALGLSVPR